MSEFDENQEEMAPVDNTGDKTEDSTTPAPLDDSEKDDSDVIGFEKDEPKEEVSEEEVWVHYNPRFHEVTPELLEKNGLHGLTRIPLGMRIKL